MLMCPSGKITLGEWATEEEKSVQTARTGMFSVAAVVQAAWERFLNLPPMFQNTRNTAVIVIVPSVPRVTDTDLPSA